MDAKSNEQKYDQKQNKCIVSKLSSHMILTN